MLIRMLTLSTLLPLQGWVLQKKFYRLKASSSQTLGKQADKHIKLFGTTANYLMLLLLFQ
jgi:hypothetical protein